MFCRDVSKEFNLLSSQNLAIFDFFILFFALFSDTTEVSTQTETEILPTNEIASSKTDETNKLTRENLKPDEAAADDVESGNVAQYNVEPDNVVPDKAAPDNGEPDKVKPANVKPDNVELDNVKPDNVNPDNVEPDNVAPDTVVPDKIRTRKMMSPKFLFLSGLTIIALLAFFTFLGGVEYGDQVNTLFLKVLN